MYRAKDFADALNKAERLVADGGYGHTSSISVSYTHLFGINIIAIESGKTLIQAVGPDYVFAGGDIIFASGTKEALEKFSEWSSK